MEVIKNELEWECLFCSQTDDSMLFEINSNSLLIQNQLIDFTDILQNLGFKVRNLKSINRVPIH